MALSKGEGRDLYRKDEPKKDEIKNRPQGYQGVHKSGRDERRGSN